jgi:hypothetical protein
MQEFESLLKPVATFDTFDKCFLVFLTRGALTVVIVVVVGYCLPVVKTCVCVCVRAIKEISG